jgi:phospholipase C
MVVIVMMENHSYDNYLGMLTDRGEGLPLGPDGTPDVVNFLPNGQAFRAHHMPSTTQVKNNPSQNWHASHIQYADGRCDGFAAAVAKALPGADPAVPMGYWTDHAGELASARGTRTGHGGSHLTGAITTARSE